MGYPKFKDKYLNETLVSPEIFIDYKKFPKDLPKKYIIIYSNKLLDYIKRKYKPKKSKLKVTGGDIYWYKDLIFVKMSGIGSPHAVTVLEELIVLGGREFLNIGLAGGLHSQGVFLCNKALRDEGTSYHYLPHGHYTYPNAELTKKLGESIKREGLEFFEGTTWTIDAPYRETKEEVEHYSKNGIKTVEMEASALFAVAKLRNVKIASAFVVSDILGKKWEPRFDALDVQGNINRLIDAAVDCLLR